VVGAAEEADAAVEFRLPDSGQFMVLWRWHCDGVIVGRLSVLENMIFIVYVSLLIAWAFGFIQYIRHVRWLWWLPFLLGKSAAVLVVIWRFSWNGTFESLNMELVSVSYSLVIVCLFLFAAQSLTGWWFWTCAHLTRGPDCSLPFDAR